MERNFYLQKLHDLSFQIRGGNQSINNNKTFSHIINDIRHKYSQELVKISYKNYIID